MAEYGDILNSPFVPKGWNFQNPFSTTGASDMGSSNTLAYDTGYTNPTNLSFQNPSFKDSPFNIPGFMSAFPFGQQRGEGQQYISSLTDFLKSQETLPAMASRIENQLMIPDLRESALRYGELASDLTSQLKALPETIAGTTRESLVTEPQRQRLLAQQGEPLYKALEGVTTAGEQVGNRLAAMEQVLGTRMTLEVAQQEKMLKPWDMQYDLMTVMQAREFTGWTFANELELDRLIANQQSGLGWSQGEADRANKLALAEAEYKRTMDSIAAQGEQARLTKKAPTDLATLYSSIFG